MTNDWQWGQIATIILGSGVVSAIVTNGVQQFAARGDRKRIASDTALKAAIKFERVARLASETASAWMGASGYSSGTWPDNKNLPTVDGLEDLDWKPVKSQLTASGLLISK